MGYSSGELAGAIVGSVIGASLVTLLIALLFFRRRSKAEQSARHLRDPQNTPGRQHASDGGPPLAEKQVSGYGGDELQWQAYLPQASDDQTIRKMVKTMFDRVELHVDNFYTRNDVVLDDSMRLSVSQLRIGQLPLAIDRLMSDRRMVLPVIKRCITDFLLTGIHPGHFPAGALLPDYLANAPSHPRPLKSGSRGQELG